ncbi:hypothetical protein FOJ82_09525 [Tessaracoccus rhinocerotis]|uniref:Uncharacterized protein n=1 Tax=Tessaracoccus rhinocerotis TaxID=1689449 RepID=A0A553K0N1_9ACTN|nr:hypothetical protein [Tessaracoccus rhinocerotis]TRY18266.1 hypothetical protein FOJ82_09525 [Tessaracoccus rhinocerotis]
MSERNQTRALWLILYLGCVLEGFALAALQLPLPEAFAGLVGSMFALLVLLGAFVIGVAVWRLSTLVTGAATTARWVFLTALVLAGMAAWFVARVLRPEQSESLSLVLFVLGLGAVLSTVLALAARTLVHIVAANRGGVNPSR